MIGADGWGLVENPRTGSTSIHFAARQFHLPVERHVPFTSQRIVDGRRIRAVVVRNPYDRLVSGWYYNAPREMSFLEWLQGPPSMECGVGLDFKRVPQTAWAFRCNHILRFERLADDWKAFTHGLGLSLPLGHENATPERGHYRDIIYPQARRIIEDRFAPDFQRFGYEW